jgi:hypothetical protein
MISACQRHVQIPTRVLQEPQTLDAPHVLSRGHEKSLLAKIWISRMRKHSTIGDDVDATGI